MMLLTSSLTEAGSAILHNALVHDCLLGTGLCKVQDRDMTTQAGYLGSRAARSIDNEGLEV